MKTFKGIYATINKNYAFYLSIFGLMRCCCEIYSNDRRNELTGFKILKVLEHIKVRRKNDMGINEVIKMFSNKEYTENFIKINELEEDLSDFFNE